MRSLGRGIFVTVVVVFAVVAAPSSADVRLTNDNPADAGGGYVSNYTMATGNPYSDSVLDECTQSRGRQNEPAVAIDPRNTDVIVGSSNDYCGVFNTADADGVPLANGPIWLGYYRSQNAGASFTSSLVPGYPGDTSPFAGRAHIRTASAGDPVLTWDAHGRLFAASESSEDPAGTKKGFGDEFVATYANSGGANGPTSDDGKEFARAVTVAKGASAPGINGKFNDKTAIEADRTGGACDGNVYFAWSSYNGTGGNTVNLVRSTDHGQTFSSPLNLGPVNSETQFPDIAVTSNGHVYVTFRQIAGNKRNVSDAVLITKSTNCGRTFSKPATVATFIPYDAQDVADPTASLKPFSLRGEDPFGEDAAAAPGDCGSLDTHCASNFTFFRRDTQVRSTADQADTAHEDVYIVYDPSVPGTLVPTGTTYGSVGSGTGSQSAIYFVRYDGASGGSTTPKRIDVQSTGHQLFPDIAVTGGALHALWWDSRNDDAYSRARPVGNYADGTQSPGALDVFAETSSDRGASWSSDTRLSAVTTAPNWEQFSSREVPFAGDYLWIDAQGGQTFGVWTDWRATVGGADPREPAADQTGADVRQCRAAQTDGSLGPDTCPRDGGLDQNIFGAQTP